MAVPASYRARRSLRQGNACYRRGDFSRAGEHYRKAVRTDPGSAEAHFRLGLACVRQGEELAVAAAEFEQALSLQSRFHAARKNLVLSFLGLGDYPSAVKHLKVAGLLGASFVPDLAEQVQRRAGGRSAAVPVAELRWEEEDLPATDLFAWRWKIPLRWTLMLALAIGGFLLIRREGWNRFRPGEKPAGKVGTERKTRAESRRPSPGPEPAVDPLRRGENYLARDRLAEAEEALREAVRLRPDDVAGHNLLARVYHRQERYSEEIAERRRVIALHPSWIPVEGSQFYNNLGFAFLETGRPRQAEEALKKALEFWPENAEACNNLGFLYREQKQLDEAIAMYRKAIALRPGFREAHYNLGWTFFDRQDYGRAWKEVERAEKLGFSVAPLVEKMDRISREYQPLVVRGEELVAVNPADAEAHNDLAAAYYFTRRFDLAWKHAQEAVRLGYKVNARLLEELEEIR